MVVQEAQRIAVASHVMSEISERFFLDLVALYRVTAPDTTYPLPQVEQIWLPNAQISLHQRRKLVQNIRRNS